MYFFYFCANQDKKPTNIKPTATVFLLDSISFLKNIYGGAINATCKDKRLDSFFGHSRLRLLLDCKLQNVSKDTIVVIAGTEFNYFPCFNALQLKTDTVLSYLDGCIEWYKDVLDSIYPNEKRLYYIPFYSFPDIENGDVVYAEISFNAYKLSTRNQTKIIYYDRGEYADTTMYRHPFLLYLNLKNNTVRIVDSTYQQVLQELKSRKYIEI